VNDPQQTLREIATYFPSPEEHHLLDPSCEFTDAYAVPEKVEIFKDFQKFESVELLIPVDEERMYFAAMNSKSCRLTAMGYQYWRLVNEKKL